MINVLPEELVDPLLDPLLEPDPTSWLWSWNRSSWAVLMSFCAVLSWLKASAVCEPAEALPDCWAWMLKRSSCALSISIWALVSPWKASGTRTVAPCCTPTTAGLVRSSSCSTATRARARGTAGQARAGLPGREVPNTELRRSMETK